jgi:hypothetical protein
MYLNEVHTPLLEAAWLGLPDMIYKNNPVRPLMLQADVQGIFDAQQNSLLQKGKVCRWLWYDAYNLPAARIAAFYSHNEPVGRIGFFESVNNEAAAHTVLDAAINWLRAAGCTRAVGPVNFGEKERFWGLLTQGADTPGLYLDNFNPPYYKDFFSAYGFSEDETIHTFKLLLPDMPVERLQAAADRSAQRSGYSYRHFEWPQQDELAAHIHSIYVQSFSAGTRIGHITVEDIRNLLQKVKPLLNEKYFWLAYDHEKPAGFLLFLNEPPLPVRQQEPSAKRMRGFAFATIPQAQQKGAEAGLIMAFYHQLMREGGGQHLFLSGINSKTGRMQSLAKKLGCTLYKTHQTFIYQIQ